jgi:uncharacterized protein
MNFRRWLACTALLFATGLAAAQDKAVYHVSDADAQALGALRNHLDTDPTAKSTVVAHAQAVDFLMEGAKDKNGSAYAGPVSALKARGAKFEFGRGAHHQVAVAGSCVHPAMTSCHRVAPA